MIMKFFIFYAFATLVVGHPPPAQRPQLQYINHVFNAVHSSMRQFGSSLNHNGMSIFIATVSKDVELYHGTSSQNRINGTEWLAFEPEHALIFAKGRRGPPARGREVEGSASKSPGHDRGLLDRELGFERGTRPPPREGEVQPRWHAGNLDQGVLTTSSQESLNWPYDQHDTLKHEQGYLHTYRTKHPLRLLYLDGQSAAKSKKGTLDLQDLVLLHDNPPPSGDDYPTPRARHPLEGTERPANPEVRDHHGPMGEAERADGLCRLAQGDYQNRIDGFIRMEGGFEIILCDFEKHLDVVHIAQARSAPGPPGKPMAQDRSDHFNYLKAVAARYDGIGGERVTIELDDFISLFTYPDVVYFDNTGRPRVDNSSADAISSIRSAIVDLVLTKQKIEPTNWQAVADMIVGRFSDRIEVLATRFNFDTVDDFTAEVDRGLDPFIDYANRNSTAEVYRCVQQHLPSYPSNSPAYHAISNVTNVLCRTLVAASHAHTLSHGVSLVHGLKSWLAWTTWKRCRGCSANEVCFLPIWPMGSAQDFEQPKCVDRKSTKSMRGGYWEDMSPPPERPRDLAENQ
nr:uncharacterized protein CFP56_23839 [Quercus suber]